MDELHNNIDNIPPRARGGVVAIGNFDGVHLGHRALVQAAKDIADKGGAPLCVLTFEPHPREFFQKGGEAFRLTLLPAKRRLLSELGVRHVVALNFDEKLAGLSADEFIEQVLVKGLGARHIVTGSDFAFGRGRSGNVATLQKASQEGRFGFTAIDPVRCDGSEVYSSTRVRALLQAGKFGDAAALLGHPWEIEAEVVHGDKRGRDLGYPTANQRVSRCLKPPYGVYAVRVMIEGETVWRRGAANFGIRPMFRIEEPIFETYIFDFAGDIYGKTMRVQPIAHLRPEMAFNGLEALKERIKQDCVDAQAVLKSTGL
ncbi:MAG: bifunctional riboflavin kinase/FAD synthetase [Alphaproteobacteria bacterium]|nr:MAG: bifunctional riboflavin kinase/FAD synthetase [Alphaproteobacteria bacterium]